MPTHAELPSLKLHEQTHTLNAAETDRTKRRGCVETLDKRPIERLCLVAFMACRPEGSGLARVEYRKRSRNAIRGPKKSVIAQLCAVS